MSEPGTRVPGAEPPDTARVTAAGAATPAAGEAAADNVAGEVPAGRAEPTAARRGLRARLARFLVPRSRKGIFALLLVVGGLGFAPRLARV